LFYAALSIGLGESCHGIDIMLVLMQRCFSIWGITGNQTFGGSFIMQEFRLQYVMTQTHVNDSIHAIDDNTCLTTRRGVFIFF
jgi:hypothetical protein